MAPYWKRVINIMCVYGLLAYHLTFWQILSGLFVSGAMFIGVGGYMTAIFNVYLHSPCLLGHPPGRFIGSVDLHAPAFTLRLSLVGVYFAIVTLMYPPGFHQNHRGLEYPRGGPTAQPTRQLSQSII